MENTDSSTVSLSQQPQLPPGFRFHPTDEELVVFYLKKKAAKAPLPVSIIAAVDIYKFDPWELPAKATFGEQEWYFFSPRERKYPNGERPNRAATSGYWKATGIDKPVLTSGGTQKVGVKKALVFYGGKPPKGIKTNWIMHEYRLINNQKSNSKQPGYAYDSPTKKPSLKLDDCVLCRIYKKKNISSRPMDDYVKDNMIDMIPSNSVVGFKASNYGAFLENEQNMFINGIINNNNNEGISSGSISMSSDQQVSLIGDASTSVELPAKQLFLKGQINTCPYTKRYLEEETNSMFNQLPQNTSFHQQMLLADADGLFRPPPFQVQGLNWFN